MHRAAVGQGRGPLLLAFAPREALPTRPPRRYPTPCTLDDGRVLIVGGVQKNGQSGYFKGGLRYGRAVDGLRGWCRAGLTGRAAG